MLCARFRPRCDPFIRPRCMRFTCWVVEWVQMITHMAFTCCLCVGCTPLVLPRWCHLTSSRGWLPRSARAPARTPPAHGTGTRYTSGGVYACSFMSPLTCCLYRAWLTSIGCANVVVRGIQILPAGSDQLDRDYMRLPPRPHMVRPVSMRLVGQSNVGRHAVAFSLRARGADFSTVCFRECWTPPSRPLAGPNGQFSTMAVDHQYGTIWLPEVLVFTCEAYTVPRGRCR